MKCIMIEENWGVMNIKLKGGEWYLDMVYKGESYRSRKKLTEIKEKELCSEYYNWLLLRVDAEDVDSIYKKLKGVIRLFYSNQAMKDMVECLQNIKSALTQQTERLARETEFPANMISDFLMADKNICVNIRN